jgi:hypothetical protein
MLFHSRKTPCHYKTCPTQLAADLEVRAAKRLSRSEKMKVNKTDGDLYNASLHALWSIYGEERGLFQLEDTRTEYDNRLGGNAICWTISNPQDDFCVFPIKDSETESIAALRVWIK